MRSPSQYSFAVAPKALMPRSAFRQDRTLKTAFDAGYLVPVFWQMIYPGDSLAPCTMQAFARLSTPVVPFMDNLRMQIFFFFVPFRILWDHWVNLCGEKVKPDDSTDYLTPVLEAAPEGGYAVGSLFDYLGFPTGVSNIQPTVWLCRAYNKIYNDHFRDENLIDPVPENTGDGPDSLDDYKVLKSANPKDYFQGALPWPQKGPGASISLSGAIPVKTHPIIDFNPNPSTPLYWNELNGDVFAPGGNAQIGLVDGSPATSVLLSGGAGTDYKLAPRNLYADLSEATAVTINSLRQAFQIQKLWEADARGGTRFGELVQQHFGVVNPDSRLQRSEYLGGGSIPIQIHSVAQTSASDTVTPQGNLAAYGVSSGRVGFSKSFTEHGVVLGIARVLADVNYQQGIDREWSARTRFDYYWPTLAHLGEQAILNKEIYAQGTSADDEVFGYQERWAELRYGKSHITGKLRSTASGSLDVWHLAQHYTSLPTLSQDFIEANPPLSRVLAVQDEPQIIFDSLTTVNAVRVMPLYSIPGLVDHF